MGPRDHDPRAVILRRRTAVTVSILIISMLSGCAPALPAHPIATASSALGGPAGREPVSSEPVAPAPKTVAWARDRFGAFDTATETGTGAKDVAVSPGSAAWTLTLESGTGSAQPVSGNGDPVGDAGAAGLIAAGTGTTGAASIRVTADGEWTLTLSAVSALPGLPAGGEGGGVYLYSGAATPVRLDTDSTLLTVTEHSSSAGPIVLGGRTGVQTTVDQLRAGPAVVVVSTTGMWMMTPTVISDSGH